jgi:hypothetical protein
MHRRRCLYWIRATGVQLQETRRGEGGERRRLTGEKVEEAKLAAGAPRGLAFARRRPDLRAPSPRAPCSRAASRALALDLALARGQLWIGSGGGEVGNETGPFRGATRPNQRPVFNPGSPNERRIRPKAGCKPGHLIPAGSGSFRLLPKEGLHGRPMLSCTSRAARSPPPGASAPSSLATRSPTSMPPIVRESSSCRRQLPQIKKPETRRGEGGGGNFLF